MSGKQAGRRALVVGMTIDAVGSGMYLPFSLVYFQRVTGQPLTVIGAVLAVAGLVGMALLPVAGTAIDRFGARRMQLAIYLVRGIGFVLYPLAGSLPAFAAVALATVAGERVFPAVQQTLIGELVEGEDRDRLNALSRSLRNGGMGAGGLLASVILLYAGDTGFLVAGWLNAASFFVAALLATRIPRSVPVISEKPAATGYRAVLGDRPFLGLTVANLLIALGYSALSVLLPVYAVTVLHAPAATAGVLFAVNTVLCAVAGVPVSRFARRIGRRTRVAAAGAAIFATAFIGYAVLGVMKPDTTGLVIAALVITMVLYTLGELVHSPAASTLAIETAPERLRGRYLATYQLSWSLAAAVAPLVFTALLAFDQLAPWLFLAGSVLVGAALLLRLERRLPAEAVQPTLAPTPAFA